MDLERPPNPDPTAQNRRQFLQRTGAAGLIAAVGVSGNATAAMDESGQFQRDPFTLGIASGDPLPNAVVIWTRLAPDPLTAGGGMPEESVDVAWTVATDEAMTDVVKTGTATAERAHAHTVHVDVQGLEPNTEYYYRFEAGGKRSPVGRTKTAPKPGASVDELRFAFASCQAWYDGFYTAYDYMARDDLDFVVHLGDYIYEYGIGPNGGVRNTSVPQAYRDEPKSLKRYRLQYGLYKSDPDLQAAHANAPWLITRDDHEVDNNWADENPQDPKKQTEEELLARRAAAFQAYYEHMPFRQAQKPEDEHQRLYRNFTFGDLAEVNVLDTRQYRDDQACGGGFSLIDCEKRLEEDRTILGDDQEQWLLENLSESTATWDVLANQLPLARMDFEKGKKEGYRMDQWDGYVADQETVLSAFETEVENPVVVTGDFHSSWANDLMGVENPDEPVGTEFIGTSITSSGDGTDMDDFGRRVIRDNENVHYYNNKRGYVRCTLTPEEWTTEFRTVDYVTKPGAPVRTDATLTVEAGSPGLQQPPTTVGVESLAVGNGTAATTDLTARWLDEGLSGASVTLTITDPEVASFTGVSTPDAFGMTETSVSNDGTTATLRLVDVEEKLGAVPGGTDVTLASLDVRGDATGTTDVEVQVNQLDDDAGNHVETRTSMGVVVVGPPTVTGSNAPQDLNGDGHYEDVNGNGRMDYDDINALFENFDSESVRLNKNAYDFNANGKLDYDDVVDLYKQVN
ncbi:alkaline phosphatase D family protein [Halarchaeum sp. P4]|uniref:alkaline phosphatase D family protein n=1 Tax=Halarchaeum sp. P4 TaxID=3421639 RepID=UPI003EB8A2C6